MTLCVEGGTTVVILGNQLYRNHPLVEAGDRVLMIESAHRLYKPGLHIQKTVLITAAMRHYAAELKNQGWQGRWRTGSRHKRSQSLCVAGMQASNHPAK